VTVLAVSSNTVAPGTLGFLVVAGMALILFFLFRSMSKHLRKVADQARRDQERVPAGAAASVTGAGLVADPGPARPGGPGEPQPGEGKNRP
jgi:hypothetical protein